MPRSVPSNQLTPRLRSTITTRTITPGSHRPVEHRYRPIDPRVPRGERRFASLLRLGHRRAAAVHDRARMRDRLAVVSGDADWPPQSPNTCTGEPFNVTLRPFGGRGSGLGSCRRCRSVHDQSLGEI
ncbi:uncharacterized protein B0H18DRAFT_361212 [Fomitopsis serialis]|uniref:uncharacterized protein n=1 Tax=Fomitopsis serialis TaxID=139415 RepID=UPI002007B583|nr:uncharacterized protein B0H18DRAFT_361212 [Neoantrodia serialis]KAH9926066.1 hypothetical protein B0H18DRAFT_361212 [Neoantrodia serialis]